MWRLLTVALLASGCATTGPRELTWNWPNEVTRPGTFLHETHMIDRDGERTSRGTANFVEKISTSDTGEKRIETFKVLVTDGDQMFETIASMLESVVTLDANGNVIKFEREPEGSSGPGIKAGNKTLRERMAPLVNKQLEHDAQERFQKLIGLWRGRAIESPLRHGDWDITIRTGEVCRPEGPAQCVRIHGERSSNELVDGDVLFRAMAREPATLEKADERREFVLVTDPATLLPVLFTTTDVTTLRGTVGGQETTYLEAHHSELNWQ